MTKKQAQEMDSLKRDSIRYWSLVRLFHNKPFEVSRGTKLIGGGYKDIITLHYTDQDIVFYKDDKYLMCYAELGEQIVAIDTEIFNVKPIYNQYNNN